MVVIFRILTIGILAFGIFTLTRFVIMEFQNRKRLSKIKRMRELMSETLRWADEIKDPSVKNEYITFCVANLQSISKSHDGSLKFDVQGHRNEIIRKYSNHIPSLKQEIRDMKIKQILG